MWNMGRTNSGESRTVGRTFWKSLKTAFSVSHKPEILLYILISTIPSWGCAIQQLFIYYPSLSLSLSDLESPKLLNVSVSGLSVYVKWTTVESATNYTLKIHDQSEMSVVTRPVEDDFHVETGLKPSTTYCFQVAAKKDSTQTPFSTQCCRTTGASGWNGTDPSTHTLDSAETPQHWWHCMFFFSIL